MEMKFTKRKHNRSWQMSKTNGYGLGWRKRVGMGSRLTLFARNLQSQVLVSVPCAGAWNSLHFFVPTVKYISGSEIFLALSPASMIIWGEDVSHINNDCHTVMYDITLISPTVQLCVLILSTYIKFLLNHPSYCLGIGNLNKYWIKKNTGD